MRGKILKSGGVVGDFSRTIPTVFRKLRPIRKNRKVVQEMVHKKFIRACIEFSAQELMKHLIRDAEGTVYVDHSKMIHNAEDESKLFYILNRYYLAGYKDIENLSPYFEIDGDAIIAGGYNIVTGKKTSKRRLISTTITTPYTCSERDIERYKEIITAAQNAPQREK